MSDRGQRIARFAQACAIAAVSMLASLGAADAQTPFRPVAVVNDSAITGYDLGQRARILQALGFPSDDAQRLRERALDMLIEDRLKVRAARSAGIVADETTAEAGIAELSARASVTPEVFRSTMASAGVSPMALDDMATAEILWRQVVRARFLSRAEPSEAEIDAALGLGVDGADQEFQVQEIGLPFGDEGRSEAATLQLAEDLRAAIQNGVSFESMARQYSRSPSAAQGGNVGWVEGARLPPELRRTLAAMEVGEVSAPQLVPGGYSLVRLNGLRAKTVTAASDPEARQRARLQLVGETTGRLAEGLLQELRRDALIEIR